MHANVYFADVWTGRADVWIYIIQISRIKKTYLSILDDQQNSKFYSKVEIRWKRICQFFGDSYGHLKNLPKKLDKVDWKIKLTAPTIIFSEGVA